jgi:arylsulfatase A-like enzyme
MIERVSTLDLTPTLLYALGLPVARDMAGRPRTDLFSGLGEPRWVDTYEGAPRRPPAAAPTSDEELLERLRSLGYIR